MTSKDFLYLGLIAVAALLSYCHGFFSGVNRARKAYESLLGAPRESEASESSEPEFSDAGGVNPGVDRDRDWTLPHARSRLSGQDLHGDFGNN